jgi:hypothetical protein
MGTLLTACLSVRIAAKQIGACHFQKVEQMTASSSSFWQWRLKSSSPRSYPHGRKGAA